MPVAPASTSDLINLIRKSGIASVAFDPDALPAEPQKAAGVLIQKGVITRFQAQQLLLGRHKGFRLGAYVILEQLGRGGMGVVYLAEHQELRRKVAVKVLVVGREEDAKLAAERFFREARAAAALDHPNIVRLFDVCRHGDTPYLVMEYVEGETLQHTIDRDGALPYTAAADAIAQAAAGLQHAHEKGFVHRDIKPGNMMKDKTGVVKILDMGLARSATTEDKLTERLDAGAVVGTADFIAPEQALNSPNVDIRADIYSLGASFFALVTGKPPFAGNTTQKLLQHQMAAAPSLSTIDASLPKGLAGVVAKMLAKKAAERFQTPAEVIAALAPWLGNTSRVLAGLSRTNLAAGADLHAKLHERAGSTGRLRRPDDDPAADSGVVNPADPAAETAAVASSQTARSEKPKKDRRGAKVDSRQQLQIVAGLAVAVGMVGAGIAFALGAFDSKPAQQQVQNPPPVAPPDPGPAPAKGDPPAPPQVRPPEPPASARPADPNAIARVDFANVKPFRAKVRGGTVLEGKKEPLPRGVAVYALKTDTEAEFTAGPVDGVPALGLTALGGTGGTQVAFELEREEAAGGMGLTLQPGHEYVARIEYKGAPGAQLGVGVHTRQYTPAAEYKVFGPTGDSWKTVEVKFTRPAEPVRMVVETRAAEKAVHVRSVELIAGPAPVVAAPEKLLAGYDLSGQKAFALRSTVEVQANGSKQYKLLSRTGAGEPPAGWYARCYNKDTHMEFFADDANGVGIRNARGPGSAMLFTPKIPMPAAACRVRIDYSAVVKAGAFIVRFKPDDQRPAWDVARPPLTAAGAWRSHEFVADVKDARAGVFEFHNNDGNTESVVRLRAAVFTEPPAGTPPTPVVTQGAATPTPPQPTLAGWTEGPVVYRLDAATVPAFRVSKEGSTRVSGEPEQLPRGVSARCWKKEATGEFRRDEADGSPAFGLTNLSDAKSGQFAFELERDLGVALKAGAAYRVKLSYLVRNEATGALAVQTTDYKQVAWTKLDGPPAAGWKVATATFERRDDTPVRLTVDNSTVGEGNTVYFRWVEVVEMLPPKQ